jgi:hypothetical protein
MQTGPRYFAKVSIPSIEFIERGIKISSIEIWPHTIRKQQLGTSFQTRSNGLDDSRIGVVIVQCPDVGPVQLVLADVGGFRGN